MPKKSFRKRGELDYIKNTSTVSQIPLKKNIEEIGLAQDLYPKLYMRLAMNKYICIKSVFHFKG